MDLWKAMKSCIALNYHSPCMPSRFALRRTISRLRVYDTSYSDSAKIHRMRLRRMEILQDSFPHLLTSTVLKRKKESLVPPLDVRDLYTHETLKPCLLKYSSIENIQSLSEKQIPSELANEKWKGKFWVADKIGPRSSSIFCFSKIYLLSLYKNLALQVQQFTGIKRSPGTGILTDPGYNLFWHFRLTYRPLAYTQEVPVSTSSEIPRSNILWFGIIEDYTALIVKFFIEKLKNRNMLIRFK